MGRLRLDSRIDGQDRLVAARSLTRFPVAIVAARTVSAVLTDWQQQTKLLIGVAGLSALVIAIIVLLIVRQLLREHEWSGQRLTLEKQRLDIAINNMAQGLLLFDASERIVVVNQHYIEMYRLSPDVAKPGCTFRNLIAHRKDTGTFVGDVDDYCSSVLRNIAQGKDSRAQTHANSRRAFDPGHEPTTGKRRMGVHAQRHHRA